MDESRAASVGTLYMVATPIGNLDDITFRAVEVLRRVQAIACEATRHSRRLLDHYEIRKPLLSAHSHNEERGGAAVVRRLLDGQDVAYVSDAGSPGVSDPGRMIVRAARDAGAVVIPIPGASATTALMSANGFPGKAVTFEGFLSPKQGRRRKRLSELLERDESFVLYESPHRLLKLLQDLSDLESERQILLGRELTKLHEELIEGAAGEVLALLSGRESIKGEIAILVGPSKKG